MEAKKPWSTPELIVLTRGTPQEQILHSCKGSNLPGSAKYFDNGCNAYEGVPCGNCMVIGNS
jgi:hypothetical protein